MDEELLPEDDSIFNNTSSRSDHLSSDALFEESETESGNDSFSVFTSAAASTSTPSAKRRCTRAVAATEQREESSPRRSRGASPSQTPGCSGFVASPTRRSARLASPVHSPGGSGSAGSPRRSARLASPARPPALALPALPPPRAPRPTAPPRAPSVTTKTKAPRLKCPKCPTTLANKKTLDTHLRGHFMTGVTSRAPSMADFLREIGSLCDAAFCDMKKEIVIGSIGQSVHDYVCEVQTSLRDAVECDLVTFLSESFNSILTGKKALFPSAIRTSIYVGTNILLSSPDFRKSIKDHFQLLKECNEEILNVFIGDFMCALSGKVLIFSVKKMRGEVNADAGSTRKKRSEDKFDSLEFRQLIYHISGAVINGFMWKGKQYRKTSKTWEKFYGVLKDLLRSESGDNQCSQEVRHFSESKDRGGYKHVTDDTFSFFMTVFELLMSSEDGHGSLPPNVIDAVILSSDTVLCLWDVLVGNVLSPDEALDLLVQLTQTCTKVVMKGIISRRLNDHLKQAYNSVALRAKLAAN